jgi:Ca2+-binding RTX toxin-like protein
MRRLSLLLALLMLVMFAPRASADPPTNCSGQDINDNRATDGNDFLSGTDEANVIALSTGDDQYFAAGGGDTLCGNEGSDVLAGENGPDNIAGGSGDDTVVGMGGADVLAGNDGADRIEGGNGGDVLRSSADDGVQDDLYDGHGSDIIIGAIEDVWFKCVDGTADVASAFDGIVVLDADC